jgi:hypothetical protein
MYHSLIKCLVAILCIALSYSAFAETTADTTKGGSDTTKDQKDEKKASFKAGADYISNNVFMGRTGIKTTPIISPDIKYTFKPGLYISGDIDILPDNKTNKLNGGNLTAGYDFDITDDLSGDVSYSKMFYNTNSTLVGSSITNIFSADLDYEIGDIITPAISADYALNNGAASDVFVNADVAHDFIIEKIFGAKDEMIISPTVGANLGSQNFYDAYIKRKVYKNKKVNALVTAFESNLSEFELLDYEFSAPLEYKAGHFIFEFTPTYAIVENGFKSAAVAKAVGLSDNTSVFYIETGIALKF